MNDTLVTDLREITEEGDLNTILKSSIGGYTKKSVQEYLAFVKNQQQSLKDAYTAEIQRIQAEKDALAAEAEMLREKFKNAEAECALRHSEEVAAMKAEYEALERDMDEAVARIKSDEDKIVQCRKELEEEKLKTEQSRANSSTNRVMLDTANGKIDELQAAVANLESELAASKEREAQLKAAFSDEKMNEMNKQIQVLLANVDILKKEVSLRDNELTSRASRLEALTAQEKRNHELVESLQKELSCCCEQNEWMENENETLGQRLKAQMDENIALVRENAKLRASGAILQRKLEVKAVTAQ